jgi:glycosyltransferase involved in cell wall biosynthesis
MLFSIVTPSYNQASYLRGTIESVLNQQAELEYIVMDGGSTDRSREIIASYEGRLAYWQSERDGGQYDAINRGFARSRGEIMGWLNSSDLYLPWTLSTVELIFKSFPEVQWITSTMKTCIRGDGTFEDLYHSPGFSARRFYRGLHGGPGNSDYLQQESCFWRRSLWEKIGGSIDLMHASAGVRLPQDPNLVLRTVSLSFHGLWVWLSQRLIHYLPQITEVTLTRHAHDAQDNKGKESRQKNPRPSCMSPVRSEKREQLHGVIQSMRRNPLLTKCQPARGRKINEAAAQRAFFEKSFKNLMMA